MTVYVVFCDIIGHTSMPVAVCGTESDAQKLAARMRAVGSGPGPIRTGFRVESTMYVDIDAEAAKFLEIIEDVTNRRAISLDGKLT